MSQELKILIGVGVVTAVLVGAAAFMMGGSSNAPQKTVSDLNKQYLERSDSNKISTASAKLTVVEFGDYQCPACGAANPIVKRIVQEYKDKINFVYRHFSFLGQESIWAGVAAECAGEQGKFWEYHNYLYENQSGENRGAFSKDNLKSFAKSLQLSQTEFDLCLDTDKYQEKVLNDTADGRALGVNSTPTFYIDGEKNVGVINYEEFRRKLDTLLK